MRQSLSGTRLSGADRSHQANETFTGIEGLAEGTDYTLSEDATTATQAETTLTSSYQLTLKATSGGSKVDDQQIAAGGRATRSADPTRRGMRFTRWYADKELSQPYDFNTPVNGDITLYAGWTKNDESHSGSESGSESGSSSQSGSGSSSGDKNTPDTGAGDMPVLPMAAVMLGSLGLCVTLLALKKRSGEKG